MKWNCKQALAATTQMRGTWIFHSWSLQTHTAAVHSCSPYRQIKDFQLLFGFYLLLFICCSCSRTGYVNDPAASRTTSHTFWLLKWQKVIWWMFCSRCPQRWREGRRVCVCVNVMLVQTGPSLTLNKRWRIQIYHFSAPTHVVLQLSQFG